MSPLGNAIYYTRFDRVFVRIMEMGHEESFKIKFQQILSLQKISNLMRSKSGVTPKYSLISQLYIPNYCILCHQKIGLYLVFHIHFLESLEL